MLFAVDFTNAGSVFVVEMTFSLTHIFCMTMNALVQINFNGILFSISVI